MMNDTLRELSADELDNVSGGGGGMAGAGAGLGDMWQGLWAITGDPDGPAQTVQSTSTSLPTCGGAKVRACIPRSEAMHTRGASGATIA